MVNLKVKNFFALLVLLFAAQESLAETFLINRSINHKASLGDYQIAVINQLFHEKKDLMYCPEIGGTPNLNVDAVVERSQSVQVENGQIIFTWDEAANLYFDQLKLFVVLSSDKKSIQTLKLEYYKYGKINIGSLEDPILTDGFNLLGVCK